MPTPSVPVSSLIALLGSKQQDQSDVAAPAGPGREKDSFLSLLDIGNRTPDEHSDRQRPTKRSDDQDPSNDPETSSLASVHVPTVMFAKSKSEPKDADASLALRSYAKPEEYNANDTHAPRAEDNQPAQSAAPDNKTKIAAPVKAEAPAAPQATDDADQTKPIWSDLSQQLQHLNEILSAIMQSLASAAPVAQATPQNGADVSAVAAPASKGATIQLFQAAFFAAFHNQDPASASAFELSAVDGAQSQGPALPPGLVSIFSDLQSIMQDMQRLLPADGMDNAAAAIVSQDNPQSGLTSLFTTFKSLMSSLQAQLPAAGDAPVADAGERPFAPLIKVARDLLKTNLDMMKTMQPVMKPQPFDVATAMSLDTKPQPFDVAPAAHKQQPIDVPVVAMAPDVNANTNTTTATPVAALAVNAATPMDSGTQSNSNNNGQNNAPPMPLMGIQSASTTPSSNGSVASFARALHQVSAPPVVDQVAFQIKTALGDGSSKIHIQLDPAELGKLDIKLNVGADGKTGVVITADNKTTLDLLQRDTSGLQRALADAGLQTDSGSLSFNLRGQQHQQGQGHNGNAALTYQQAAPDNENDPADILTRSYVVNLADGLDIRI